jgi:(p)ppGpp synthase/HD superfamily hydrolase
MRMVNNMNFDPIEPPEFTEDEEVYVSLCYDIAYDAHEGVTRAFVGEPYIEHPTRVAQYVRQAGGDIDQVGAAYLHDVIEDTPNTRETLLSLHVRPETIDLVEAVSRREEETYREFITRVLDNPRAVPIKRADISDNLATLPIGHGLAERYVKALKQMHGVK